VSGQLFVGVDPGETTGLCLLPTINQSLGSPMLLQTNPAAAKIALASMLAFYQRDFAISVALEEFVVSQRAARSRTGPGQVTRSVIEDVAAVAVELRVPVQRRRASDVKPWATDARLEAAGLAVPGMRHARDAARQALFAAVKSGAVADPLSKAVRT
jgi:hypothetical protein